MRLRYGELIGIGENKNMFVSRHTGPLEVFHNHILMYAAKRFSFRYGRLSVLYVYCA